MTKPLIKKKRATAKEPQLNPGMFSILAKPQECGLGGVEVAEDW